MLFWGNNKQDNQLQILSFYYVLRERLQIPFNFPRFSDQSSLRLCVDVSNV